MKQNKEQKLDALIFIDTNIFLDFYRIRKSDVSLKYLEEIEKHVNLIITTSQVEMEFKKNRQSVILNSLEGVNKINNINIAVPAILLDSKAVEDIEKSKKQVAEKQEELKERMEKILKEPLLNDPVYKSLDTLFFNPSPLNLNRENEEKITIRELAEKRFLLNYPPRKSSDNSIGDAVNWEWIVKCAKDTDKDIIIVTRDSDFGCDYRSKMYLNDWLKQEFKERTNQDRDIVLTNKLFQAFQWVDIPVTEDMIYEEENVINLSKHYYNMHNIREMHEAMKKAQENLKTNELQEAIKKLQENLNTNEMQESIRKLQETLKTKEMEELFKNLNRFRGLNH